MAVLLAATEYGAGPPVAILHGLFGSGRNWRSVGQALAAHHRVLAFDLRNHGASPWADGMAYDEMVADLQASLGARGIGRTALLGHSLGGKVAMVMALRHPAEVDRLVVADIAPVPYPPNLLGHVRAMRGLDLRGVTRRSEVDTRLAGAIPDAAERAFLLQNVVIGDGETRWRLNLDAIERGFPQITGFPELPGDALYDGPTLFIAGARSNYIRREDEPRIRRLFPRAQIERIEAAGHWVHAEQPWAFIEIAGAFLSGADFR
jgi:pimeloyl-ACP methyl ester carboxylesterase